MSPSTTAPIAPTGFVGRESYLAQLRADLRAAAGGVGRIALIGGEAGIGKTWLSRQVLADPGAAIGPSRVRWARCSDATGVPSYWPWRELLGEAFEPAAPPSGRSGPEDRFERLRAALERVREACQPGPLALVVDDLQWADVESVLLLDMLAPEIETWPLLIVATLRESEEPREAPREIAALLRRREVRRIGLEGFGLAEIEAFLARRIGADAVDSQGVRALQRATGGNPYLLDELLQGRSAQEILAGFDPVASPGMVETLSEQLARRVERLDSETRRVLASAAVLGREFSSSRLIRLLDAPGAAAVAQEAVERMMAARLVEPDERPGHFRFVHPLVPSAVLSAVPPLEQARLHGRVGSLLARESEHPGNAAASLARHFTRAARLPEFVESAVRHSIRAGYEASREYAHPAAEAHYRDALDLLDAAGDELDPAPYGRPELLLALGQQVALRSPRDADELLVRAEEMADALAGTDALRAARIHALALVIRCEDLQPTSPAECRAAHARGERALERLGDGSEVLRARLLAALTPLLRFERDRVRARGTADAAVRAAEASGDATARARALEAIHWTRLDDPADEERLAVASRVLESAASQGDAHLVTRARIWRYLDLLELGRIEEAEAELSAVESAAADSSQPRRRFEALCLRAGMSLHRGLLDPAEALAREARELAERVGIRVGTTPAEATLTRIAIERDESPSRGAREGDARDSSLQRTSWSFVQLQLGRRDAAETDLAAFMRSGIDAIPRGPEWLATLHTLAWLAQRIGDREACAALYAELTPHADRYVVWELGSATSSVRRLLMTLATMLERFADAEAHFEPALALAERADARLEWAHTYLAHASLRLARGESASDPGLRADVLAALRLARGRGLGFVEREARALCPSLAEPGALPAREVAPLPGLFRRRGTGWTIGLGERVHDFDDLLGFHFISALLARPGRQVLATELVHEVSGHSEESIEKARLRVTARVRVALERLGDAHPDVSLHLRRHLRTGKRCGYFPSDTEPVDWSLEAS